MKKFLKSFIDVLAIAIFVTLIIFVYNFYKKYYFNDFVKAQLNPEGTSFTREEGANDSKKRSYCIENNKFNDAVFYKEIKVEQNTPYRVSCKIKTEGIEKENKDEDSGACISLVGTNEQSKVICEDTDWKEVTFCFDSKSKENINLGFRLGGNNGNCKGKAWFTDIKLQKGNKSEENEWNTVCFILNNVDVTLGNTRYNFSMTDEDKYLIKEDYERFKNTCEEFSGGEMKVITNLVEVDEPLTTLSYDEENQYYVDPSDVREILNSYLEGKNYDHIFIALRMGDTSRNLEIPVNEWIGLGGMDLDGIGFSDLRMPNDMKNSFMYKYSSRYDTFPEEVFVHEFLHTLERNLKERGYDIPALHDSTIYGYSSDGAESLKKWYHDYMAKTIDDGNGNQIGLDKIVYSTMPLHDEDFIGAEEIEYDVEPSNFIATIIQAIKNLKKNNDEIEFKAENSNVVTTI